MVRWFPLHTITPFVRSSRRLDPRPDKIATRRVQTPLQQNQSNDHPHTHHVYAGKSHYAIRISLRRQFVIPPHLGTSSWCSALEFDLPWPTKIAPWPPRSRHTQMIISYSSTKTQPAGGPAHHLRMSTQASPDYQLVAARHIEKYGGYQQAREHFRPHSANWWDSCIPSTKTKRSSGPSKYPLKPKQ